MSSLAYMVKVGALIVGLQSLQGMTFGTVTDGEAIRLQFEKQPGIKEPQTSLEAVLDKASSENRDVDRKVLDKLHRFVGRVAFELR